MTAVTSIIGKQVGVQFQGTKDMTNFPSLNRQTNLLMLVDGVKRGRLDETMSVTYDTLKSKLGFDRDSLEYQAVEDVLLAGVPSVAVMRCYTDKDKVEIKPVTNPSTSEAKYGIYIDDVLIKELTLSELKANGFKHGTISITWDSSSQKFNITGA